MAEITRSKVAMALAALTAVATVISFGFYIASWAVLTPPTDEGTVRAFVGAADWFAFIAGLLALVAVCAAGWEAVMRQAWIDASELGGAAVATLLFAIGRLINATSLGAPVGGDTMTAVGIGGWILVILVRAARQSLFEQRASSEQATRSPSQVPLWLVAAAGLLFCAIGSGITADIGEQGPAIASFVLQAVGLATLFGTLVAARNIGYLRAAPTRLVLAGLCVSAVGYAVFAVVAGIVSAPTGTILDARIGTPIAVTILLIGAALLGGAAWLRLSELVTGGTVHRLVPPPPSWYPNPNQPGAVAWWDGTRWHPAPPEPPPPWTGRPESPPDRTWSDSAPWTKPSDYR
jgi:hypothetical protein